MATFLQDENTNLKLNDCLEVDIIDYNSQGEGVAKQGGFVLFVPGAILGERVKVCVAKLHKSYAIAKVEEIIQPSNERLAPKCKNFEECGGCSLQYMSYPEQLRFKARKIQSALRLKTPPQISSSPDTQGYRNKSIFPCQVVKNAGEFSIKVGMFAPGSHDIIEIDMQNCIIHNNICAKIVAIMREITTTQKPELTSFSLCIRSNSMGEFLAIINSKDKIEILQEPIATTIERLKNLPNLKGIVINGSIIFGNDELTETLCGAKFNYDSKSFLQTNKSATKELYSIVVDMVKNNSSPKPIKLVDLYCGVGTIGICAAKSLDNFEKIELIGIEQTHQAIIKARKNAQLNGISNSQFICSKAEGAELAEIITGASTIILDPPRAGCDKKLVDMLNTSTVKNIIYVSCDVATLARDITRLNQGNFTLTQVRAVDMFPHTPHVETVALLTRD
ncbi:MAG: 23S rRNA (uracil(1939)-C(5))-methyltransferase RlmD [Clostridiales bacterium]|jgi:23S rRNA (uracil1939-C5)-methyltransferase|nr:23S rRNA (uracil(1939)-C(5))-methyltransferase RlmD [Clostridiales bacterium]